MSETLDIDPDKIVIVQGDSDIAQGIGSMGSRSLYIGGSAMLTASKQTIDKGRELASEALEAAAGDIEYRDGRFKVAGTDLGIGLFDLAAQAAREAHRHHDTAESRWPVLAEQLPRLRSRDRSRDRRDADRALHHDG